MDSDILAVLKSIDASLKKIAVALAAGRAVAGASTTAAVASESDMDSQYGDPEVRVDPRDWMAKGNTSMKGRRLSECPPEYLDLYAELKEYFARKADETGKTTSNGKPASRFDRADAARARGWAKRIREGKHKPQPVVESTGEWNQDVQPLDASDIPF